jgi:hypothetical protein
VRVVPYRKVSGLDALLREQLREENAAWKKMCFIVPSRRDRGWWRKRAGLSDFGPAVRAGSGGTPDRVLLWNWEDLYGDVCAFFGIRRLRQIDPPDHRLVLSHIVAAFLKEQGGRKRRKVNRGNDEEPSAGVLESWPGLSRPGFVDILTDDIRELINEAVSPDQLAVTEDDGSPTSKVLPELYRRYLAYLAENSLMDSAQIPLMALSLLGDGAKDWAEERRFTFAGFMSFTGGQLALVRRIEELCLEDVTVFKPAAELEEFQDATWQLRGKTWEEDPPLSPGTVASFSVSEPGLEQEAAARQIALWYAGKGPLAALTGPEGQAFPFPGFGALGMTTPAQRLPALESALRRYRIPYSLARGRSVAQTLLGTTLGPLWTAWIQGLEPYETALLLAQPWTGSNFPIDEAVRAGPRGVKGWEAYLKGPHGEFPKALKAFKALVRFCRALEKGAPPAGLLDALHVFLTAPGLWLSALANFSAEEPDLDETLRELSASVTEVDAKRAALQELQPDLGPAGGGVLKGKEAVHFLTSWCEETLVRPSPPLAGAVALYAGPPPILASYPVWIMTDVTQKNWPGAIRSSPLLDAPERERMSAASAHLPSLHDKRVQKEALFRRLLQTGDALTVAFRSVTDENGRPAGKVSFMESFFADMKLWEHVEFPTLGAGDLTPGGAPPDEPAYCFTEIEPGPDRGARRFTPAARSEAVRERFPVSDLSELLDCPLRYWLRREARLKERSTALFSAAEAGLLTHKIWEKVWLRREEEGDGPSLAELAAGEWRRVLAVGEDYAPFGRMLRDPRLKRHIRDMEFYVMRLAGVQDRILECLAASGTRRVSLRVEADLTPYELDGVTFVGRCDRMEVFEDGVVIVDYKWGKSASYDGGLPGLAARRHLAEFLPPERKSFSRGLQLSAYALMHSSAARVAGVGFLGHRDGGVAGTFEPPALCYAEAGGAGKSAGGVSLAERMEEAREAMRCAAGILKAGRYEPFHAAKTCTYCDMKGVCRRGEMYGESLLPENEED